MNGWQLFTEGITAFPMSNPYFTIYLEEKFTEALKECKEVKKGREEDFLKGGSPERYGFLYLASVYHHPFFRMLRSFCYSTIIDGLRRQGTYTYRSITCKFQPVSLSFYVEKPEFYVAKPKYTPEEDSQINFEGWFNLSSQFQSIFYLKGDMEYEVKVPPGYAILYNAKLMRRNDKRGGNRFYLAFTLSKQDMFTEGRTIQMIENQSSPYENTLYRKKKEWKEVLIDHPLISTGKETPSLKDLGMLFPPYSKQDINIVRPIILF